MTKQKCKVCNEVKKNEEFYFSKRDGLSKTCRHCQNLTTQKRRKEKRDETKQRIEGGVKTCSKCKKELDLQLIEKYKIHDLLPAGVKI